MRKAKGEQFGPGRGTKEWTGQVSQPPKGRNEGRLKIEEFWKRYTASTDYQLDIRVTAPHELASRCGIYIVRVSG